jgi:hypothetical protein
MKALFRLWFRGFLCSGGHLYPPEDPKALNFDLLSDPPLHLVPNLESAAY